MTTTKMLSVAGAVLLLAGCSVEESVTECTTAAESEWLDQEQFQADLRDQGYEINEFKVTPGNCYEIYGRDDAGEKVEIYFDPTNGSVVKEERG